MDDELKNLEAELAALRPLPPAARVERKIAAQFAVTEPRRGFFARHVAWAALPVAAAIMFAAAMRQREGTNPAAVHDIASQGAALKPVAAENLLYAASDEGLVMLEDGTPARRARLQYVDTFVWKNPRTNASLTWRVPREEVRIVPVSFQ